MKRSLQFTLFVLLALGCEPASRISETEEGFRLGAGTTLLLILETPLYSDTSNRLDPVEARLKSALTRQGSVLLPEGTRIMGFVKRAERFSVRGSRAALGIVFDQILLADGTVLPISAALDTDQDAAGIKIQGQALQNTKIIAHSALAGSMVGDAVLPGQGAQKGIAIGTGLGSSAIFLSKEKSIELPAGTEMAIKLTEPLLLPHGKPESP